MTADMVIIGGSYAGLQAAVSARQSGFSDKITIISAEPHPPYHRPPLSKGLITGKTPDAELWLRPEAYYLSSGIELLLSNRASLVDRRRQHVMLENGAGIPYRNLVLATGARARMLRIPGADLDGVCYLRTLEDAIKLKQCLPEVGSVAIIGGGFIGLELAASVNLLGRPVTIIEASARLLSRAVSPRMSDYLLQFHRARGNTVLMQATVEKLVGDKRVSGVVLSDRSFVACDLVVVGIGAEPNSELAEQAGLEVCNGIVTDGYGRTNDPAIFAAGDCCFHENDFAGRSLRIESVQNASDQGRAVGASIAGRSESFGFVPRFWSDQFDAKFQMVGICEEPDLVAVRGRVEDGRFSLFLYQGGRLMAIESVNRPADQVAGRKLLAKRASPSPDEASDPSFDLLQACMESEHPGRQ